MLAYFSELFGDLSSYDPDLVFVVASSFGLFVLGSLLRIVGTIFYRIFDVK